MSPATTTSHHQIRISPNARRILRQIAALEAKGADRDLSVGEKDMKRKLAALFLDLPEISVAVSEALAELERKTDLSWEVREYVIERFEDGLLKFPDAALSMPRLRGLMRLVTSWGFGRASRVGKNKEGDYILEHPDNAARLDELISGEDGPGSSLHEVAEGPASVDVVETVMRQQRLAEILRYAEEEGVAMHRTVLRVMLGWKYGEIAAVEEVSENAIAKRLERFRRTLAELGV